MNRVALLQAWLLEGNVSGAKVLVPSYIHCHSVLGTGDWVGGVVVRALAEGCDQLVYVYFYPALVRQQFSAVVCG